MVTGGLRMVFEVRIHAQSLVVVVAMALAQERGETPGHWPSRDSMVLDSGTSALAGVKKKLLAPWIRQERECPWPMASGL